MIVYANKPIKIVLRGTDQDNDLTTFELVSPPAKGVLSGFSETTGTVTYVPDPTYTGLDSFTFKIVDIHSAESNIGQVSAITKSIHTPRPSVPDIRVITSTPILNPKSPTSSGTVIQSVENDVTAIPSGINSPPISSSQNVETKENRRIQIVLRGMDTDGDKMTYSIVTDPSHGKLISFDSSTGKLTYRPAANYAGEDDFTFKIMDERKMVSNIGKVSIKISSFGLKPSYECPWQSPFSAQFSHI